MRVAKSTMSVMPMMAGAVAHRCASSVKGKGNIVDSLRLQSTGAIGGELLFRLTARGAVSASPSGFCLWADLRTRCGEDSGSTVDCRVKFDLRVEAWNDPSPGCSRRQTKH